MYQHFNTFELQLYISQLNEILSIKNIEISQIYLLKYHILSINYIHFPMGNFANYLTGDNYSIGRSKTEHLIIVLTLKKWRKFLHPRSGRRLIAAPKLPTGFLLQHKSLKLLTAAKIIVQLKAIIKTPATKGTDACLALNVLMCAKRLKSREGYYPCRSTGVFR